MITTSVRMQQVCVALQPRCISSLYAIERHPEIVQRTDLQFCKLHPTAKNLGHLTNVSNHWMLKAQEREKDSTDIKIKNIFNHLSGNLSIFSRFLHCERIGWQGREVYLSRNGSTKKIEAVAFGRELNACNNICPHFICANPDHIPNSFQSLNQSLLEGPDSFLLRGIVKYGSHYGYEYLWLSSPEIQSQGYKNIISNVTDDSNKIVFSSYTIVSDLRQLDFQIHGTYANIGDFPSSLYVENLSE